MKSNTKRLMIGTAQWGLNYGISNKDGQTNISEIKRILELARCNDVISLDTAKAYGSSEKIIGSLSNKCTEVTTKIQIGCQKRNRKEIEDDIRESVYDSYEVMGKKPLRGVLVHDPKNLGGRGQSTGWEVLQAMKAEGYIIGIGLSIEDPSQAIYLSEEYNPDIIQMPMNVFDKRVVNSGALEGLKKRGVEVHIRSIFLQGLMLMNPEDIDPFFNPWKKNITDWQIYCQKRSMSRIEGALLPIIEEKDIDKFIVGIANYQQLKEILNAVNNLKRKKSGKDFSVNDNELINPSKWQIRR